ncbi:MAG: LysR family transcriptional regulator [Acidimicrobiales bacterium]
MDLLQLRYFQAVARRQHVSRAAEELHVAQPSLSRAVGRLEAELGVPLFDRHGRRVRLNRFGVAFLGRVDAALAQLDQARAELDDAAGLEHGSVAVAAETLRPLTGLLASFLAAHPGVSFRLYQSSDPTMAAQLQAGEVDLCVASQPLEGASLEVTEVASEEVLVAVPPKHPLARGKRIRVAELAGQPFVTTRPGHWQRALTDQLFAEAGLEATIACEGDEPAAIRPLISAGLGVGLLPAVARRTTPHPPVAWLRLDAPSPRRTVRLVWRDDAYLSTAARRFRDGAIEHLRDPPGDA